MPAPSTSLPGRLTVLLYGSAVYALFGATFLLVIGFLSGLVDRTWLGLPAAVPATGAAEIGVAIAINAACLGLFAVQHTIMARPAFKARWTRIIPAAAERSTFVLVTCLILLLMVVCWRPIAGTAWTLTNPTLVALVWGIAATGWAVVLWSSALIDHFELFGLRQVVRHARGLPPTSAVFRERSLYRLVRHPLMTGFLIAFWACPVMTWDRLLFAVLATGYITLVGLRFEERDLRAAHGEAYADYSRRVPRLIPGLRPQPGGSAASGLKSARL